jgi:oxygen-independent coproporphyrinogen III oxidase
LRNLRVVASLRDFFYTKQFNDKHAVMDKAGLYIHFPFCTQKCNYCDFYSVKTDPTTVEYYIETLIQEIGFYSNHPIFSQTKFASIFFGGGTPSLLSSNQLNRIIKKLYQTFNFAPDREFTIETNPESLSTNKLKDYFSSGVNRLSIGVQSFSDVALKRLGRNHKSQQAEDAIFWAQDVGFQNISIDLIFAIPGLSQVQWEANLRRAINLNPHHISTYGLTIAPGTVLEKRIKIGLEIRQGEETERQMYLSTIDFLTEHNYQQYEISNFAKPGFKCLHNETYWDFSPYLSFGPSAHSYWENRRQWNVNSVNKYFKSIKNGKKPIAEFENLTPEQKQLEFIFLSLRQSTGVNIEKFEQLFQISFLKTFKASIKKLESYPGDRLFTFENNFFKLTSEGFVFYNEICGFFV